MSLDPSKVEFEDNGPKLARYEMASDRMRRQREHNFHMEMEEQKRRETRRFWLVKAPLTLVMLAGATVLAGDYFGAFRFGIFKTHPHFGTGEDVDLPTVAEQQEAAARRIEQADATPIDRMPSTLPTYVPRAKPPALATELPEVTTLQATNGATEVVKVADEAPVIDAAVERRLMDKVEKAQGGVDFLSKQWQEHRNLIENCDADLFGPIVDAGGNRNKEAGLIQKRPQVAQWAAQFAPGTPAGNEAAVTLSNMDAAISNDLNSKDHEISILQSIERRLAQAQKEKADADAELAALRAPLRKNPSANVGTPGSTSSRP